MPQTLYTQDDIANVFRKGLSDNTFFMRWATELEQKEGITTKDFFERNRLLVLAADKFTPQANYQDPRMMVLHKLKIQAITLSINAGLIPSAEETALSIIDDVQITRGDKGFWTTELNKQRHELVEKRQELGAKRIGIWNRLFSGKKPPEEQQEQQ